MGKLSLWIKLLQACFYTISFSMFGVWELEQQTLLGSKWSLIGRLDTQREGSSDLRRVTAVRLEKLRNVEIGYMGRMAAYRDLYLYSIATIAGDETISHMNRN